MADNETTELLDITALQELLAAATPLPWMHATHTGRKDGISLIGRVEDRGTGNAIAVLAAPDVKQRAADAVLIAALRNAAPALLAELERLRGEVGDLHSWIRDYTPGLGAVIRRAKAAEADARELEARVAELEEALAHAKAHNDEQAAQIRRLTSPPEMGRRGEQALDIMREARRRGGQS